MQASAPGWVEPQLATTVQRPFSDPAWIFEPKLDGVRVLAAGGADGARLWSRNQHDVTAGYPDLVRALDSSIDRRPYLIDGEIVAFEGGRPSFARLQQRMHLRDARRVAQSKVKVWLFAFDLLYDDGHDVRREPQVERKKQLASLADWTDPLLYVEHVEEAGEQLYDHVVDLGWEGVVAKRADAPYRSGRTRNWLKIKAVREQEFVVGGFTPPKGARSSLGALLIGYYDEQGSLVYAGRVGTGFSERELTRLYGELTAQRTESSPFADAPRLSPVHWVRPSLVVQVGYSEWTSAGLVRQPRYLGQRRDKEPREVVREA